MDNFRKLNDEDAGFINDISNIIAIEKWKNPFLIPNLSTEKSIFVFSDYSFVQGNYKTYSFMIIGRTGADYFNGIRKRLRKDFFLDNRRMSYKGLNDTKKLNALQSFLSCVGAVDGLIMTFVVDKRLDFVFAEQFLEMWPELSEIKKTTLEEMLRVVHFGGLAIMNAFSKSQNIIWVTDNDAIVANDRLKHLFGNIAETSIRTKFLKNEEVGKIGFAVTDIDNGTLEIEDFVSIPDLVAGAICETFDRLSQNKLHITSKITIFLPKVKNKTSIICEWIAKTVCPLKKIGIVLDKFGEGKFDFKPTVFLLQNPSISPCETTCNAHYKEGIFCDPIHYDFDNQTKK
jgi:hypothetical protein